MNGTEIKKFILELEKKYPVDEWQIQGIDIWPYIRIKLYIDFLKNKNDKPSSKNSSSKLKSRYLIFSKIGFLFRYLRAHWVLKYFFSELKTKKIIFFGSHFHRSKHPSGYFNRFFDSMVDYHQLQKEVYMVEFQKVYERNYNQKAIIPLHKFLDHYKVIRKVNSKFEPSKPEVKLKGYSQFYDELRENYTNIDSLRLSQEKLIQWSIKIIAAKGFFIKLFKKVNPSKIIFLSYYGFDDLSAAILAAHKLGVKTIDFQHGPQTNIHMAYSSWSKVPKDPFNIMPMEYWNWDERSKENIEEWAQKTYTICAKVVGQPYLSYCLDRSNFVKTTSPIVFYSLQTFALRDMMPPKLIKLIEASNYHWVLRLHPRSNFSKSNLQSYLNGFNIDVNKFTIQDAGDAPLSETLANSFVHVTNFSGCLIEAQMMGVQTILIHELGKEIFLKYIDDILVYYLHIDSEYFENQFSTLIEKVRSEKFEFKNTGVINPLSV